MTASPVVAAAAAVAAGALLLGSPPKTATIATAPACSYQAAGALPDPACTPGATNPDVTQETINQTICVSGWTATIRPPQSVTGPEKRASMAQYGVMDPSLYEYDHLISLELGGAANDSRNLWPEPHAVTANGGDQGSFAKDQIENGLKAMICAGQATLAAAQYWIAHDWRRVVVGQPLPAIVSAAEPATTAATVTTAPAPVTATTPLTACQKWPGRHYLHHRFHKTCKAGWFTTP